MPGHPTPNGTGTEASPGGLDSDVDAGRSYAGFRGVPQSKPNRSGASVRFDPACLASGPIAGSLAGHPVVSGTVARAVARMPGHPATNGTPPVRRAPGPEPSGLPVRRAGLLGRRPEVSVRALPLLALAVACSSALDVKTAPPSPTTTTPAPTTSSPTTPTTPPTTPTTSTTTPPTTSTASCPPGVICVEAFPFTDVNTTTGGDADLDAYGCAPTTDESGPEVVYRLTLDQDGFLAAGLRDLPAGVDVDVHLLEQLDADTCVDRGHWRAGALLPAGTWYVVVDSWVDAGGVAQDGDYTLDLGFTRFGDFVFDGLSADALEPALYVFDQAWQQGETDRFDYVIVDFSVPSTDHRLFALDLQTSTLTTDLLVTHGSGSQDPRDLTMAANFSNVSGSLASSLGLAVGAETYYGTHGYSLRMDGLDPGFNDNIRDRAVVVHNADYATQDFVDDNGYLGRSNGCWVVDPDASDDLVDLLAEGALLFTWAPEPDFLADSVWLRGF
jgi:hypothetical protein